MDKEAYKQMILESGNWLHRGRRLLLKTCLDNYLPAFNHKNELRVLEIGAGSGKNIEILSMYGQVDAIEIENIGISELRENASIVNLYTKKIPFELNERYHIISAMDVLEHVEDDQQAFNWIIEHLEDNGILFLTVPAFQFLFSDHDVALNHCRRYTRSQLTALNNNGTLLLKTGYFNFALFPLVFVSRLAKKAVSIPRMRRSLNPTKQLSNVPPIIDAIFYLILKAEVALIRRFPLFPFGITAFAVIRNK